MRFVEGFDIEAAEDCDSDALEITDPHENRQNRGTIRYCNGQEPQLYQPTATKQAQILARSNSLNIKYLNPKQDTFFNIDRHRKNGQ